MKNILIPTDFSNNAYNALLYTTQLFGNEPCKFYLLHSFESEVSRLTSRIDIGRSEEVMEELFSETEVGLLELKHSITMDCEGSGHVFEIIASSRMLTTEVNYLIMGMNIDYVVMGTKGQTGAREVLLGSTAIQVIKKIKGAPLLVVPEHIDYHPVSRIAFAAGLEFPYTDFEVRSLTNLAETNNASIQILHIRDSEQMELDRKEHMFQLIEKLKPIQSEVCWLEKGVNKTEVISDYVYNNQIDILAIVYYKYGFLKSLFRESIVKKVALHPGIPFLMIPSSN